MLDIVIMQTNTTYWEAVIFWTALIVFPALWILCLFTAVLKFSWTWAVSQSIGIELYVFRLKPVGKFNSTTSISILYSIVYVILFHSSYPSERVIESNKSHGKSGMMSLQQNKTTYCNGPQYFYWKTQS